MRAHAARHNRGFIVTSATGPIGVVAVHTAFLLDASVTVIILIGAPALAGQDHAGSAPSSGHADGGAVGFTPLTALSTVTARAVFINIAAASVRDQATVTCACVSNARAGTVAPSALRKRRLVKAGIAVVKLGARADSRVSGRQRDTLLPHFCGGIPGAGIKR